jgi:putrescine transport system permease protein
MARLSPFLILMLTAGLAFLYLPILTMVAYSFNASRLPTVWGGFSTRWYARLLDDPDVLDAALLSLKIAALSATLATLVGVFAAFALVRYRQFAGRGWFAMLVSAPLAIPEVVTGFASLVLFIYMNEVIGWPARRGFTTVTLVHATLAAAFVTVLVQSRMGALSPDCEDAAADLGGRPFAVFAEITLPMIAPAVVSGWLLAFTLSIDDLVLATFTTGPGSTTLPIFIWSKVKFGMTPEINALATLMIGTVTAGALIAAVMMIRQERRRVDRA